MPKKLFLLMTFPKTRKIGFFSIRRNTHIVQQLSNKFILGFSSEKFSLLSKLRIFSTFRFRSNFGLSIIQSLNLNFLQHFYIYNIPY